MPRWAKVVLIVGISGVVLVGLAIGGFAWWIGANKAELRAKGLATEQMGRDYGRGKDSNACIDDALVRLGGTSGIMDQAMLHLFFSGCLQSARRDPALCTGVPTMDEIWKTATWRNEVCAKHGKPGDDACARLFGMVQEVCHPKSPASAP